MRLLRGAALDFCFGAGSGGIRHSKVGWVSPFRIFGFLKRIDAWLDVAVRLPALRFSGGYRLKLDRGRLIRGNSLFAGRGGRREAVAVAPVLGGFGRVLVDVSGGAFSRRLGFHSCNVWCNKQCNVSCNFFVVISRFFAPRLAM